MLVYIERLPYADLGTANQRLGAKAMTNMIEVGSRVGWKGTDGRLHLGIVDEITGSRAVVMETAISRRAGKETVRWSVSLTELQVQESAT